MDETTRFDFKQERRDQVNGVLKEVLAALEEKGYNPVSQLVGYFLSGDPTYITNHNGARAVIRRLERDEILEVIITDYIDEHLLETETATNESE